MYSPASFWSGGPEPIFRPMTEETLSALSGGALKAAALIRDEASRAPDKPGVYRM